MQICIRHRGMREWMCWFWYITADVVRMQAHSSWVLALVGMSSLVTLCLWAVFNVLWLGRVDTTSHSLHRCTSVKKHTQSNRVPRASTTYVLNQLLPVPGMHSPPTTSPNSSRTSFTHASNLRLISSSNTRTQSPSLHACQSNPAGYQG